MTLSARRGVVHEILPWRDMYRAEMNCQVIHDSLHERAGWTEPYLLLDNGTTIGYGSVAVGGPWKGHPAIFEFYVAQPYRARSFDLFSTFLATCHAGKIETQSNDPHLTVMLHTFAQNVTSESILYHDRVTTSLPSGGAVLRRATPEDAPQLTAAQLDADAEWLLEIDGSPAATGGILFHYNRPYGDIYMAVAAAFRRRGFGSYLVQELKRVCYEQGSVPAARCNPTNVPSRRTLQKAGFVPCGHILTGEVRSVSTAVALP